MAAQEGNPKLYYFSAAGRAEICRLVARAGGVQLDESYDKSEAGDLSEFGSPGATPVLQHGDVKLSQSVAIAKYLASISPVFANLTPAQQAKDLQFAFILEDAAGSMYPLIFGDDKSPETMKAPMTKWFPVIEGLLPESGFINGEDFPTMADLCVLLITEAYLPFGSISKFAQHPIKWIYTKITAHAERVKAVPAIEEYLASSTTMKGNPSGI